MGMPTPHDRIVLVLSIMLAADAQMAPRFQAVIGTHGEDFSKDSDIVFLLQRSGVTVIDLKITVSSLS